VGRSISFASLRVPYHNKSLPQSESLWNLQKVPALRLPSSWTVLPFHIIQYSSYFYTTDPAGLTTCNCTMALLSGLVPFSYPVIHWQCISAILPTLKECLGDCIITTISAAFCCSVQAFLSWVLLATVIWKLGTYDVVKNSGISLVICKGLM